MKDKTLGFALTGSFCTFKKVIASLEALQRSTGAKIIPILSETAYHTDTRFGKAEDFIHQIETITGEKVIHTISGAEPIGPKNLLDALIIAPCTGNTLAKLANGITDTSVTMAAKATLRNKNPLIIAPSTNDGLGASARNIGCLLNTKLIYFVPFTQDDPITKNNSLVADMSQIEETLRLALMEKQLQPVLL
ncbi:MAG: dipicolinate synthase subunit B [Ruminococcaceae bacterium]|nr:dipicolinate synthase subunit B [Oscillospiraceae bacterium]